MFSTMEHHKNWGMEQEGLDFKKKTLCKSKFKTIIFSDLVRLPEDTFFYLKNIFKKS